MEKRLVLILAVCLILALIVIVYFNFFHFRFSDSCIQDIEPTPNSLCFDYYLKVESVNGSVLQGNSIFVNVTISFLQGDPENVTLAVSGVPVGADYFFSESQGLPLENRPFHSILTINVSDAVPSDSYLILITSTAENGSIHLCSYNLFVLESGILVSGRIYGGEDVIPTEIVFRMVENTGEITHRFEAVVEEGYYEIDLPNNKFYYVAVFWEKMDGSSGIHHFIGPFRVNVGVGVTSIDCPFSWESYLE